MPLSKDQFDLLIRLKAWILHEDGTVNQTTGVFKWRTEGQRMTNIRVYINKVLASYRGGIIKEVRFYDKELGGAWVGTYQNGRYMDH
jgi:hypothetical protein